PGGKLAVFVNGVVSLYSGTGTVLWQHKVAPAAWNTRLQSLSVSQSTVLVAFSAPKGSSALPSAVSTFLNAADGQPLGKTDVSFASPPFLVGNHVLADSATGSALEGYDPVTGRTLWSTPVPSAPDWQAEVDDGSVVYLNSVASPDTTPPAMRRIDRLDAATGRMLPPITLPRSLDFDLSEAGGNAYAQGHLVLLIVPPCGSPGCTASETVAVDPGNGTIAWSHPGNVQAASDGLFSQNVSESTLTAVSPSTGRDAWTWNQQGAGSIGTDGGPDPLLLQPGYLSAWTSDTKSGTPAVIGINPHTGQQTWTSRALPDTMYMNWDSRTIYAFSCTPWDQGAFGLCSSVTLLAIAA
ncbi:MAG: PQQ-binding-like beta-propeller repeat protein, partial [Trebonia sp.]